jgi:hypothetical protein
MVMTKLEIAKNESRTKFEAKKDETKSARVRPRFEFSPRPSNLIRVFEISYFKFPVVQRGDGSCRP